MTKSLILLGILLAVPSFGQSVSLTRAGKLSVSGAPHGAQILRSDDGGRTWKHLANVKNGKTLSVDMTKPSRLFKARLTGTSCKGCNSCKKN